MTQQTRLNMWIPEVKTFFFGLLKTRSIQSLVVHKSDLTRGSLWITDVCEDLFFGLHLTFRKYGSFNVTNLTFSITVVRLRTTDLNNISALFLITKTSLIIY